MCHGQLLNLADWQNFVSRPQKLTFHTESSTGIYLEIQFSWFLCVESFESEQNISLTRPGGVEPENTLKVGESDFTWMLGKIKDIDKHCWGSI